jgi:hypothetical protein
VTLRQSLPEGQADDAARLISWLCGDAAAWITGQVIDSEEASSLGRPRGPRLETGLEQGRPNGSAA